MPTHSEHESWAQGCQCWSCVASRCRCCRSTRSRSYVSRNGHLVMDVCQSGCHSGNLNVLGVVIENIVFKNPPMMRVPWRGAAGVFAKSPARQVITRRGWGRVSNTRRSSTRPAHRAGCPPFAGSEVNGGLDDTCPDLGHSSAESFGGRLAQKTSHPMQPHPLCSGGYAVIAMDVLWLQHAFRTQ